MPGSRLEVFDDSGHFPQLHDPERFSALLSDFIATTEPAAYDTAALRERLLAGAATPKPKPAPKRKTSSTRRAPSGRARA